MQVKFNAWNKVENRMHYDILNPDNWSFSFLNQEIYTWLQWIGLNDKYGTEIQDGDVVQFNGRNLHVCFGSYIEGWDGECPKDGHSAIGWYMCDEDEKCIKSLLTSWMLPDMKQIEVIGNIYENPELITNKEINH